MTGNQKSGYTESIWNEQLLDLYQARYDDLVAVARRYLDCESRSQDAVQDAFLRCHSAGASPEPGCEYAYLRVCVANVARGILRRRQLAERKRESPPAEPDPTGEWVEQIVTSEEMDQALTRLSSRQRDVLILRHVHGLSEAESAMRLGVSIGSVKTHSSRARHALRAHIEASLAA